MNLKLRRLFQEKLLNVVFSSNPIKIEADSIALKTPDSELAIENN